MRGWSLALLGAGLVWAMSRPALVQANEGDTVPLPLVLPQPAFSGTPKDIPPGTTVEKPSDKPRAIPRVPRGTVNVARGKRVTSSSTPFFGEIEQVTDGQKEALEDACVELKPRLQWVQIDLGASMPLSWICVWHQHNEPVVYHDVVVQLSDDPRFVEGVTTVFNNDQDNTAGLGVGQDREYWETYEGKLISARNVRARYVRLYSWGSTFRDPLNRYTEVEVFGIPPQ